MREVRSPKGRTLPRSVQDELARAGIEVTGDMLRLNPRLPEELERPDMRIRYRGHTLDLRLTREALAARCREPGLAPLHLAICDEVRELAAGTTSVFKLDA